MGLKTASGDIRLDGASGSVIVQSTSGEVGTSNVDGNLVVQTTSGEVSSRNIAGQLGFKSVSGELVVRESRLTSFYCNTASGDCEIEAALEPGEYEVRTVSGDISLRVQPDLSALLMGRTVSGSFRCDLPYRHADGDWRTTIEDEDDGDDAGRGGDFDDVPEISLPGFKLSKEGLDVAGFLRVDDDTVELPVSASIAGGSGGSARSDAGGGTAGTT